MRETEKESESERDRRKHTETETKSERPLTWQANEMPRKYFQRFRSVPITWGAITPQRNCSQSATCLGFAGFHVFKRVRVHAFAAIHRFDIPSIRHAL